MPNHTNVARPSITMAYSPRWMNNTARLRFPIECKSPIDGYRWNVHIPADYIDAPKGQFDYLGLDFVHQLCEWPLARARYSSRAQTPRLALTSSTVGRSALDGRAEERTDRGVG